MAKAVLSPFIEQSYSSVYAYAGVAAIRARLVAEGGIVVWNEDDSFRGILTLTDVVAQSHHLVIDCLREKPLIRPTQSVREVLRIMLDCRETVLPVVYERGELAGLVHQRTLVEHLLDKSKKKGEVGQIDTPPPLR